jgi:hypothetical protein
LAVKLNLTFEYLLAIALSVFVATLYLIAWVASSNHVLVFLVALFSSFLGAFLIPFGFWGADFAFDAARRGEEYVYVPFLARAKEKGTGANPDGRGRNYTPLEWWNLNWFVITIGVAFISLGVFVIGYDLARGML